MILDLNDPKSIVTWWKIWPERHGPLLLDLARMSPDQGLAIRAAIRQIKADPAQRAQFDAARVAAKREVYVNPVPVPDVHMAMAA